jgi:uncharacterized repeat protein (TIGR01451 family)
MFKSRRFLLLVTGLMVAVLGGGLSIGIALGQGAGQVTSNVSVVVRSSSAAPDTTTFSITTANQGTNDVKNLEISGILPENTTLVETHAGDPGTNPAEVQSGRVVWFSDSLAAGAGNGPYVFTVKRDPVAIVRTTAEVKWTAPDAGTTTSAVAESFATQPNGPNRGCGPGSCHDPKTPYNLVHEATSGAAAKGLTHPDIGSPADVTVQTCLVCHGAGQGPRAGLGTVAPLSLRDIVHPKHMFSPIFLEHYTGNCYTCHNVNEQGKFVLLPWGKLSTDSSGIPNNPPVGGILPSELSQ